MLDLVEEYKRCYFGVAIQHRGPDKMRLLPWVELRGDNLEEIRLELLRYSIKSTLRKGFLRVQGIQNYINMTQFVHKPKFLDIMNLFSVADHLSEAGQYRILQIARE